MARSANGVFISYRRNESGHAAGRLADRLITRIPRSRIFMDVDGIGPGDDFTAVLSQAVLNSGVLIAIIGPRWTETLREYGDDRSDWVRWEISLALRSGIRVIPVLVDDAQMPESADLPEELRGLATRNAVTINLGSFSADIDRLIEAIVNIRPRPRSAPPENRRSDSRKISLAASRQNHWIRSLGCALGIGLLLEGLRENNSAPLLIVGFIFLAGTLLGWWWWERRRRPKSRT